MFSCEFCEILETDRLICFFSFFKGPHRKLFEEIFENPEENVCGRVALHTDSYFLEHWNNSVCKSVSSFLDTAVGDFFIHPSTETF